MMYVSDLKPELYGFIDEAGAQLMMTPDHFILLYGNMTCSKDEFFPDELIYIEEENFLFYPY